MRRLATLAWMGHAVASPGTPSQVRAPSQLGAVVQELVSGGATR